MLEEYKKKEIARCDRVIASYQEDIDVLQAGIEELKEKHKKVFEEIAETEEIIGYYRESQKQWEDKKRVLNGETVETSAQEEPAKKTRKKREKKEEVPAAPADAEQVIDTIYPENNEPEETEDEGPEFDGAGFTDADRVPPTENTSGSGDGDLFNEVWPEEVKKEEPKDLDAEEDNDWDEAIANGELKEIKPEESELSELAEEDFPEEFEEWK